MTTNLSLGLTCTECKVHFNSLVAFDAHPCSQGSAEVISSGRCEDYPCCGHTDGASCQPEAEGTMSYWLEHPDRLEAEYPEY